MSVSFPAEERHAELMGSVARLLRGFLSGGQDGGGLTPGLTHASLLNYVLSHSSYSLMTLYNVCPGD